MKITTGLYNDRMQEIFDDANKSEGRINNLIRKYKGSLGGLLADDKEVIVRTLITGRGDPVQLDYRLEKTPGVGAGWKIYNLNVLGVWLVDTYRSQFAQEINAKGIDGLIVSLTERNKSNAAANAKPAKS